MLSRGESSVSATSMSANGSNVLNKSTRNVAPGRHIIQAESIVIHKTLGSGEFGTVQQGVWTSDDNERVRHFLKRRLSRVSSSCNVASFRLFFVIIE